jgi:4a-hydroxytetrahydrobiopterin dehydratase
VVNAIGAAAEEMDHHPDLNLRHTHLDVQLASHDVRAVTDRDIRLARTISSIAADARAVLAMEDLTAAGYDDELRDPFGVLPAVWFQKAGSEGPRQRWHPDLWVDPAEVRPRIEAALAAGGTLVSDEEAPSFWVLADPDGNKVCLCTWQERDGGDG